MSSPPELSTEAKPAKKKRTPATTEEPLAPRARLEVLAAVLVAGVAVMLIEILGTRIIGPVFGVNLFVWSALLTVTLGALAIGYYAGGVVVDRSPALRLPSLVLLASGLLLTIVPVISHPVLRVALQFGPRAGALSAATALFAPSLIVLGMLGPIAIRLVTRNMGVAGRSAGSVYAISTGGSLLGTLLTGFVIIPMFDVDVILFGASIVLIGCGALFFALSGKPAALGALVLPFLTRTTSPPPLPPGLSVIDRAHSLYGLVEVIQDDTRHVRLLRSDHSVIGAQFVPSGAPAFAFIHILESIRFLRPNAQSAVQLGLGIGSLPLALQSRGLKVDVVEIDPTVIRFAVAHFGFNTRGDTFEEDARTFINRAPKRYDFVVHDTFTGGTTPEHLLSIEVVRGLRNILVPNGVVALNFVGHADGEDAAAASAVARTLREVFHHVRVFRDSRDAQEGKDNAASNLLFFASDSDIDFRIPDNAVFENDGCERTSRAFGAWEVLKQPPPGQLITDANNPLARLEIPTAIEHFYAMNQLLPVDVWIRY
jgi:MFS family permease